MLISVIIPVYNAEKHLRRCIDSILAQTFTDIELLLVDDGSKDKSGIICDKYAAKDSRIRVFHKENGGVSSARNMGIDEAKGDWLSFIDSDDWIEPTMYERMLQELIGNNADICMCDINMYWGRDAFVYENCLYVSGVKEKDIYTYINCPWNSSSNILARKSLFEKYKLRFPEGITYCEDFHLTLRLLYMATKIVKVNEPLYVYDRTNEDSAMHQLNQKKQKDRCWCDMDIVAFFREQGVYGLYENAMADRVLAYTQEWVLDKTMWKEFIEYYPESHSYIMSCIKVIGWRKCLMWCLVHKWWLPANMILFLKNIRKNIKNA